MNSSAELRPNLWSPTLRNRLRPRNASDHVPSAKPPLRVSVWRPALFQRGDARVGSCLRVGDTQVCSHAGVRCDVCRNQSLATRLSCLRSQTSGATCGRSIVTSVGVRAHGAAAGRSAAAVRRKEAAARRRRHPAGASGPLRPPWARAISPARRASPLS